MTSSSKDMKAGSVLQSAGEDRRRAPLDQLPPPANSNKPLTPFSIEDILSKPSVKKSAASVVASSMCPSRPRVLEKVAADHAARNGINAPSSPLCALEELASKTFKGLEVNVIQAAEGTTNELETFGQIVKKNKSRMWNNLACNRWMVEICLMHILPISCVITHKGGAIWHSSTAL